MLRGTLSRRRKSHGDLSIDQVKRVRVTMVNSGSRSLFVSSESSIKRGPGAKSVRMRNCRRRKAVSVSFEVEKPNSPL
jgi:hypothetical protein